MIKRLKNNRFYVQLLLVTAVFLNAAAPLSAVADQLFPSEEASLESLLGSKIIICTPTGFKYISYDDFHNNSGHGLPDDQSHCALCQISTDDNPLFQFTAKAIYEIEIVIAAAKFNVLQNVQKLKSRFALPVLRAPPFLL